MAFDNVKIRSTRGGVDPVDGYRDDLETADVVGLSLTSLIGVTSVRWEIVGRPEGSSAGGAGPEPCLLGVSPTAAFVVDDDDDGDLDGTYKVRATINPGSPGEVRKEAILCRLWTGTAPGLNGAELPLRLLGGHEALVDDASIPTILQGWATMLNRWLKRLRAGGGGGGGGGETLAATYALGSTSAHQRMTVLDAKGGTIEANGAGAFTGATLMRFVTKTGGPVVVASSGRVGVGVATPLSEIHVLGPTLPGITLEHDTLLSRNFTLELDDTLGDLNVTALRLNGSSARVAALFKSGGGIRTDFGVSIGTNPLAEKALTMTGGSGVFHSEPNEGRLIYHQGAQRWEISANAGAYRPIAVDLSFDSIAAGGDQLSSFALSQVSNGKRAWVATVGASFYYDQNSTLTADGITVVSPPGGVGRWIRDAVRNPNWWGTTAWTVDWASGSDEGATTVKTVSEIARRLFDCPAQQVITITIVGDLGGGNTSLDQPRWNLSAIRPSTAQVRLVFIGAPTTVHTGTISGVQVVSSASGSTTLDYRFTDTSLVTSFAAGDAGQTLLGPGLLYERTSGGTARWHPCREISARVLHISVPTATGDTPTDLSLVEVALQNGDPYRVRKLPKIGQMLGLDNVPVLFSHLHIDTPPIVDRSLYRLAQWKLCSFSDTVQLFDFCQAYNCGAYANAGGANLCWTCPANSGGGWFGGCAVGNGTATTEVSPQGGDVAVTYSGVEPTALHKVSADKHRFLIYDTTTAYMLEAAHNSYVEWNQYGGARNTGALLRLRPGCRVKYASGNLPPPGATSNPVYILDPETYAAGTFTQILQEEYGNSVGFLL